MNDIMLSFIKSTLEDDDGISERSYNIIMKMYDALRAQNDKEAAVMIEKLDDITMFIKATDGRFYLPENEYNE